MRKSIYTSKMLFKRFHMLLAQEDAPKQQISLIVDAIGQIMQAQACALYITNSDKSCTLYTSYGINKKAPYKHHLNHGEGLVGTIFLNKQTLNLVDARQHPNFIYNLESNDGNYISFLGIPLINSEGVIGVLFVQNTQLYFYSEEDVELFESIGLFLTQIIKVKKNIKNTQITINKIEERTCTLQGSPLNIGIAYGNVLHHKSFTKNFTLFHKDSSFEYTRLTEAMEMLHLSIDRLLYKNCDFLGEEQNAILKTYRMLASDHDWAYRLKKTIYEGYSAEGATKKVYEDIYNQLRNHKDLNAQDHLTEFKDLTNRLLRHLSHQENLDPPRFVKENTILVAKTMASAEILDYPLESIKGLVLETALPTSHITIIAKAMLIPIIGQVKGAEIFSEDGDPILIDGESGKVFLRPHKNICRYYTGKARGQKEKKHYYQSQAHLPAVTKDGKQIELFGNAGLIGEIDEILCSGAKGIGLFRTEMQFMLSSSFLDTSKQEEFYQRIYQKMGNKCIIFRTMDIGADKNLPYFETFSQEENPALGWRAIRLTLDRSALMRTQIRALLRASQGRILYLLLPMVTTLYEIDATCELIEKEKTYLSRFEYPLPEKIQLGVTIEVPSLLFQLEEVMKKIDFASIGTNDLFQFTMACDRSNATIFKRYDLLSLPFLRVLRKILESAERHSIPIYSCGEMSSTTLEAMALIGLGANRLSMSACSIGPIKAMIRSLNREKLHGELLDHLQTGQYSVLRDWLLEFAKKNHVTLSN